MQIIQKYFNLTLEQEQRFAALQRIYSDWNARINVISRKDMDNLYERHVLHSLAIAKVFHFKDNTTILDAGTGGGFPGIPLAIMFPSCKFLLLDSIGKKIKVVKVVAEELELKNVQAKHLRVEQEEGKFDFIMCRAVTNLSEFYQWVKHKIKKNGFNDFPNGVLVLKGGDVEEEIKKIKKTLFRQPSSPISIRVYELKELFEEEFFETKKLIYINNSY